MGRSKMIGRVDIAASPSYLRHPILNLHGQERSKRILFRISHVYMHMPTGGTSYAYHRRRVSLRKPQCAHNWT